MLKTYSPPTHLISPRTEQIMRNEKPAHNARYAKCESREASKKKPKPSYRKQLGLGRGRRTLVGRVGYGTVLSKSKPGSSG